MSRWPSTASAVPVHTPAAPVRNIPAAVHTPTAPIQTSAEPFRNVPAAVHRVRRHVRRAVHATTSRVISRPVPDAAGTPRTHVDRTAPTSRAPAYGVTGWR